MTRDELIRWHQAEGAKLSDLSRRYREARDAGRYGLTRLSWNRPGRLLKASMVNADRAAVHYLTVRELMGVSERSWFLSPNTMVTYTDMED